MRYIPQKLDLAIPEYMQSENLELILPRSFTRASIRKELVTLNLGGLCKALQKDKMITAPVWIKDCSEGDATTESAGQSKLGTPTKNKKKGKGPSAGSAPAELKTPPKKQKVPVPISPKQPKGTGSFDEEDDEEEPELENLEENEAED